MATFGSFVVNELRQVEAKTEKRRKARQEATLKYLLTGDKTKMYADPGKKFQREVKTYR